MAPQMIKLGHIDSSLMGLSMRVTFCIDKPLLLNVLSSASEAGMGQYIDFPIFFNILVMLILILILNSGFPKYRYWSWSWNLQVQNLDLDIDIEKNGILISILILILRKNSKIIEKLVCWRRGKYSLQ